MPAIVAIIIAVGLVVSSGIAGYAYGTMVARPPVETVTDAACRVGTNHAIDFVQDRWGSEE